MSYLLGIDVSTTGAKALLIGEQGAVIASATTEYSLATPRPLWSEQSPADWWQGAGASIGAALSQAGLTGDDVAAVGLTGQMHGLVLLDESGQVLRPAILWNDQRTGPQCAAITEKVGGLHRLLQLTGNAVLPGFTAPKIAWVRENEPNIYERVAHILLPKDYVRYCLTGEYATEVSDASGMSLLDVANRRWSKEMLAALDIPIEWLPRCTESPEISGRINAWAAQATGLKAGTPVVGGGGDQAAQAVGSGIVKAGVISVTSGTSGVVFAHSETYAAEAQGRLHAFCHAVPGKWHLMGVMLSAGGSFRWLRDSIGDVERVTARLTGDDPYDLLTREAAQAQVGSEGLIFLPYLTGERTPYPDPRARGAFVGLTLRHGKAHLVRSVLEGVSFGLRDSLELIRGVGVPIEQVRASGGGARSPLWRQIQADVFGTELVLVNVTEGAAFGAALLAGVGAGTYASVDEAVEQTVCVTDRTLPIADNVRQYQKLYAVYRSLYPVLQSAFHNLAD
ncbi:MAG TPA: xylulokinase [Anaerolineae bacterium]|nr:xylulokinase [Anaerolineae bacterium]